MDANGWFGQSVSGRGDGIFLACMEPMLPRLRLWLEAYGRPDGEKIQLLIRAYEGQFPETCRAYQAFMEEGGASQSAYLRTLDFILSSADRELAACSDGQVQELVSSAKEYLGAGHTGILTGFLEELKKDGLHTAWAYRPAGRKGGRRKNGAFTLEEFSRMAYWTFSPEAWERQGLVKKAAASGKCAKLWLFMALHFVCALRKADMERLPAPALCGDREAVRRSILAGSFTDQEAQGAADGWLFLIDTLEMVPSKTGRYAGVPAFKIFIPTSRGFEGQLCDQ